MVTSKSFNWTPPELFEAERRLDNWHRWLCEGGPGLARCGSAEGMYVAPRVDDIRLELSARAPIDVQDAEKVERCLCSMRARFSSSAEYLVAFYHFHSTPAVIRRKFKLQEVLQPGFRIRSLQLLTQELSAEVVLIRKGRPLWSGVAFRGKSE